MRTSAFNGTVVFETTYRTVATDRIFMALSKAFLTQFSDMEEADRTAASLLAVMLSCTRGIQFGTGQLPEEIDGLRNFWTWYTATIVSEDAKYLRPELTQETLAEALTRFEDVVGNKTQRTWYDAYKGGRDMFPAEKSIAHPDMLSPQEKADPNS